MYSVDRVLQRVVKSIQDPSFDSATVLELLNEGLFLLALRHRIPELMQVDTIDTALSTNIQSLPADYHSHLYKCWSTTHNRGIPVFEDRRLVDRKVSTSVDNAGSVDAVARWGINLYYQRIPSTAETLRLYYYQKPTLLVEGGEFPSWVPEGLENKLLGSYAKMEAYRDIEDGLEGETPNTNKWEGKFNEAYADFVLFHGAEPEDQNIPLNFFSFDQHH